MRAQETPRARNIRYPGITEPARSVADGLSGNRDLSGAPESPSADEKERGTCRCISRVVGAIAVTATKE